VGKGKKEINQDFALCAFREVMGKLVSWLVLADGLTLAYQSELAAEVACKAASKMIEQQIIFGQFEPKSILSQAAAAGNGAVLELPFVQGVRDEHGRILSRPMCTIIILLVVDGKPYVCWAGDSRLYAIYSKEGLTGVRRLTVDDSELESRLKDNRANGMSYQEAYEAASKSQTSSGMTQCLGMTAEQGLAPHIAELSPKALLNLVALVATTDGVHSCFDPGPDLATGRDRPMPKLAQAYVESDGSAAQLVDQLVRAANDVSADNNTAAAILLQPRSEGA
jgi:serine/threonine protein phosphatase PrpC